MIHGVFQFWFHFIIDEQITKIFSQVIQACFIPSFCWKYQLKKFKELKYFLTLLNYNFQDNLRRFKKEHYNINRQEEIVLFFGDFQQFLSEDEMWSLSESIKPRGQTNKSLKWQR